MVILFKPLDVQAHARPGESLLTIAREAGITLQAVCGGHGSCGRCRVRVTDGNIPTADLNDRNYFSPQQLDAGWRLACRIMPQGDMTVTIPQEFLTASQRLQFEGETGDTEIDDPVVVPVDMPADIESNLAECADDVSIKSIVRQAGIMPKEIRYSALQELSTRIRQAEHNRFAVRQGHIIGILEKQEPLLGVAIDAGTTKLAAYLLNLETGATLAKLAAMNPQVMYGADVLSRIAYCMQHTNGREELRASLLSGLNETIGDLCEEAGVIRENIFEAVIVGNTAVHHLLCGFPVYQLGMTPYVPAVGEALEVDASLFGLEINKGGRVFLPENIGGYIGGDHTAMLLTAGPHRQVGAVLTLDIGTNTEVTLSAGGRMFSCSCASGPAFEGAHIRHGMRAAAGAVEGVILENNRALVSIIDKKPALGLCGSGMLDAVAELAKSGIIDRRGNFVQDIPEIVGEGSGKAFILVPASESAHGQDIVISRKDINEIQLAKAAIRTGIDVLLHKAGVNVESLSSILIAGAFGSYLNLDSAIRIGLLPDLPAEKFRQVGNAAGTGARAMLLSLKKRREAGNIARKCECVELNSQPDFKRLFMKNMYLVTSEE